MTGEVIFKDAMRDGASVSGILQADYRGDGRVEVIVCSAEGEVRAYLSEAARGCVLPPDLLRLATDGAARCHSLS